MGAGPSGLEAARALGQRGYKVTLAEAKNEAGGRVSEESRLPGLAAWSRVRDWRIGRIQQMENVKVYYGNELKADEIMALDFEHIIVATGSHWRGDGVGISNWQPIPGTELDHVFTPEVVFADRAFKRSCRGIR